MKIKCEITLLLVLTLLSVNSFARDSLRKSSANEQTRAAKILPPSNLSSASNQALINSESDVWLKAANRAGKPAGLQQSLFAIPAGAITVAPNQPAVQPGNTEGIINALCDVPLYILGCGFAANAAVITCDTNGDGIPELQIRLKDVRVVNGNLIYAVIPALSPQLPGTAFPLACCGGIASLTLIQQVGAGDNNIFGEYTLKATCPIELGARAPVILSVVPSGGDCAIGQNLQVPGSCFLLPDGKPNVTSVFAVEKDNPGNVIEVTRFVILSENLIDAFFEFGEANAGKTFLIYAGGPSGTSRNLITLPQGAPTGCPTGNEQGIQVTFTCAKANTPDEAPTQPPPTALVQGCRSERSATGVFSLIISGLRFKEGAMVTVGGVLPKRLKFKDADPNEPGAFRTIIAKGRACNGLPGVLLITNINERPSLPFQCNQSCSTALNVQEDSTSTSEQGDNFDVPLITGCRLERASNGSFRLIVDGQNFAAGATVQVGTTTLTKAKFRRPASTGRFNRIICKAACTVLPGVIVVTNPFPVANPSAGFHCNMICSP
jgi:hypothetical protein